MGSAPLHTSRSTPQEATSHLRTNQSPDQAHIKISLQILLTSFNLPSSDHFPETQHLTTHINKSYKIYNLYKSALILVPVASNNTQEMAEASYLTSWMCWRRNPFSSPSHSSSPREGVVELVHLPVGPSSLPPLAPSSLPHSSSEEELNNKTTSPLSSSTSSLPSTSPSSLPSYCELVKEIGCL